MTEKPPVQSTAAAGGVRQPNMVAFGYSERIGPHGEFILYQPTIEELMRARTVMACVKCRDRRIGVDLRSMARGQVTIVAFWSRFCGPAIEALPALQRVSARLALHGVRTISVIDEAAPSPALLDFLRSHDVRLPVFLDDEHLASQAFNQWGTPYFYVLDAEGRVVFDATTDIGELLLRAEAVRMRGGPA